MIMDRLKDAWSKADKEGKSEAVVLASDLSVAIQRLEDIYSGVDLLHVKALVAEETRKLEMTKKQIESLAGIDKAELENQMSQMDRERHNLISENLALTRERNRLILNDNSFKKFLAKYRATSAELALLAKEVEDDEVNRQISGWSND